MAGENAVGFDVEKKWQLQRGRRHPGTVTVMHGAARGILLKRNERSKQMTLFAIVDGGIGALVAIAIIAAVIAASDKKETK